MSRSIVGLKKDYRYLVISLAFFAMLVSACSKGTDQEMAGSQKPISEVAQTEGSFSKTEAPKETQKAEGSGGEMKGHPDVLEEEKLERRVFVPENVKGKWKAVKILIRNKTDESKNELKTVDIGSSFVVADTGIKVTVGPFFPNFVMDKGSYTSMNNQLINPAVQLVVEEDGKTLYKGWTFARYPTMYAFEHERYALELKDQIPVDIS